MTTTLLPKNMLHVSKERNVQ